MLRVIASFLALFAFSLPVFAFNAELTRPLAYYPASPTPTPVPNAQPIPPRAKPVVRAEPLKINEYPFDNRAKYRAGFVGTRAGLNLGTRTVGVPVALRVAGGAAGFAVSAFNPWVAGAQLALLAVPFIVDWFNDNPDSDLSVVDQVIVKAPGDDDGFQFDIDATRLTTGQTVRQYLAGINWDFNTPNVVATSCTYGSPRGGHWEIRHSGYSCPPAHGPGTHGDTLDYVVCESGYFGAYLSNCTESGAVPKAPTLPTAATLDDLEPMAQTAIDPQALAELDVPIMVEDLPIINPAALPEGQVKVGETNPAPELFPRPIRYPNGDPILIPGTDPPLYTQPWFEVTGDPTPDNPWRVSVAHVTTTTNDPAPVGDPTDPVEPPPPPFDFYTDCDKFPASLACSQRGEPPDLEDIPDETRTFALQAGATFSGSGCPSTVSFTIAGNSLELFDSAVPCGWISGLVKPVFILLAVISAVFIVRKAV